MNRMEWSDYKDLISCAPQFRDLCTAPLNAPAKKRRRFEPPVANDRLDSGLIVQSAFTNKWELKARGAVGVRVKPIVEVMS